MSHKNNLIEFRIINESFKLTTMGLDIEFILNHQLRKPVLAAIIEHKNQIQEAIGRKAAMDEWRPLNLQTTNVSYSWCSGI